MPEEQPQEETPARDVDFSMVIASAVHDMKNSLGMFLQTLDGFRDDLPPEYIESPRFNTLQYEAERVHGDLVQLLGIYRIQNRTLTAHIEEHFIPDFLEEQLARHQPLIEGHGLSCAIESEDISGFFDAELIIGVINNTINNAIRYTHRKILLSSTYDAGELVFQVEDDGQGYPEHMLNAARRSSEAISFETGSTHLGLYFADSIARLHTNGDRKGSIALRNGGRLGGGVFEIRLP